MGVKFSLIGEETDLGMVADFIVIVEECSGKAVSRSMKESNQVASSEEEKSVSPLCVAEQASTFGILWLAPMAFLHSDCYSLL